MTPRAITRGSRLPEPVEDPAQHDRVTPTEFFARTVTDPDATLLAIPAPPPALPLADPEPPAPGPSASSRPRVSARAALAAGFRAASWPRRAILLLLPVAIALFVLKGLRQQPRAQVASTPPPDTADASVAGIASSAPTPPDSLAPSVVPLGSAVPLAEAPRAGLTLQRRALDEFAAGNFREAAALYQRLATENPEQAAFAVAARLAQARASGGARD